jgi:hypothetical protein
LALTSPTSGGSSVAMVRSRTQATEFILFVLFMEDFCLTYIILIYVKNKLALLFNRFGMFWVSTKTGLSNKLR